IQLGDMPMISPGQVDRDRASRDVACRRTGGHGSRRPRTAEWSGSRVGTRAAWGAMAARATTRVVQRRGVSMFRDKQWFGVLRWICVAVCAAGCPPTTAPCTDRDPARRVDGTEELTPADMPRNGLSYRALTSPGAPEWLTDISSGGLIERLRNAWPSISGNPDLKSLSEYIAS